MTITSEPTTAASADASDLPRGWRRVKFGDVVRNVDISVRNPLEQGIERYLGLEHMDPESLHIKRWGLIEDGITFTRKFVPGQVFFGKRRAYQRKVAVAEFTGICSGDILVFEPASDDLISELLPFIVQSEGFFQHALGTSAGSLSPRTRWRDLAEYEFALPPIDEQRRIAEILWAAEDSAERYVAAYEQAWQTLEAVTIHLMQNGMNQAEVSTTGGITHPAQWPLKQLAEIAEVERGKFAHRPRNLPKFYGGSYPFVQTGDIASSKGVLRTFDQTLSEEGKQISRRFPRGAILITIAAIIGMTTVTEFEVWCPDSVVGIVPDRTVDVRFLEYYLRTRRRELDEKSATQSAQKNINLGVLRPLLVPVPPLQEQRQIVAVLSQVQHQAELLDQHAARLYNLKHALQTALLAGSNVKEPL